MELLSRDLLSCLLKMHPYQRMTLQVICAIKKQYFCGPPTLMVAVFKNVELKTWVQGYRLLAILIREVLTFFGLVFSPIDRDRNRAYIIEL